jgi:hypothetical protein
MAVRPAKDWLMAPGQDEAPALSALVDQALNVGEQRWKALYLVQDAAAFHLSEEAPWIGLGCHADIRVFQGKIRPIRERHLGQSGLSRLTRSEDGHHGVLRGGSNQFFCYVSSDHDMMIEKVCAKNKLDF